MEYRLLGRSGLKVSAITLGTMTFGQNESWFRGFGAQDLDMARRMLVMCLDAGVNLIDTADMYSDGVSEEILGQALKGRRQNVMINTKTSFRNGGSGPNDVGSSRARLIAACEASLRRLQTDYIDIYHMHGFDALTPVEEVLRTLETLVQSGKVRFIGCSNFSGWHAMKSLNISDRYGWSRYVSHQAYYNLVGREYEWELMPLALDQGLGTMVWSPLGWGRLNGKYMRGKPAPQGTRLPVTNKQGPPVPEEYLYRVVDALKEVAGEADKTISQVALNWLLQRPTISTLVIGARTEQQLRENLGAVGWKLSAEHMEKLDKASAPTPIYPYWHQAQYAERNPPPVPYTALNQLGR